MSSHGRNDPVDAEEPVQAVGLRTGRKQLDRSRARSSGHLHRRQLYVSGMEGEMLV